MHGEGIDDPLMMIRDENSNQIIEDSEVYGYTKNQSLCFSSSCRRTGRDRVE